jgi:hypothetical protein
MSALLELEQPLVDLKNMAGLLGHLSTSDRVVTGQELEHIRLVLLECYRRGPRLVAGQKKAWRGLSITPCAGARHDADSRARSAVVGTGGLRRRRMAVPGLQSGSVDLAEGLSRSV